MILDKQSPRQSLNKAFLKVKINRNELEIFKLNLSQMIKLINEEETEEFHKNLISQFLKDSYYGNKYFINTKGRSDLVIHNGDSSKSSVGVILEVKKPLNKLEMISLNKMNVKAFQELLLYYLRERITNNNIELKHLIATNLYEWFIFDANLFEKFFANDRELVRKFKDFEEGRLSGKTTDFFYKNIAEPAIDKVIKEGISYTHFSILEYEKLIKNGNENSSKIGILYKLLSPENMLKLPFVNDSNHLNQKFYSELLHIIGLSEYKKGSQKLIIRNQKSKRNNGSLIENAIAQLEDLDKISRLERPNRFGKDFEERIFNVALELVITWINRVLFLKLLEGQLINYHNGDKTFLFLNYSKIKSFEDLNNLFFGVLARKETERSDDMKNLFPNVPYLNSSLFEPSELEHSCFFISQLRKLEIPVFSSTVLKDNNGKKRRKSINTLEYLFEFLNSYDFSSDTKEEIQEENKTLINASVLGLIFEKINGYKEGSFFTPGYITMFMAREVIRKIVIQKFNELKGWKCKDFNQLYNLIEDKQEANDIINDIKICDPAVGSGHFLVSALNEILAIKSQLKILLDQEGRTLRDYHVEVVNDDLIVTDEDGKLFTYNPRNKESQRVQQTLFIEKKKIIENCLFGVDINPNSVNICRLRLWIELLKNAYYKPNNELETLPNIDINIKYGNSLVSRYSLDSTLGKITKKSQFNVRDYINAVNKYRNAESKQEKREMENLIADIKNNFESKFAYNDTEKLLNLKQELNFISNQLGFFEKTKEEKLLEKNKVKNIKQKIEQLEQKISEIKSNKIYENAFEWRFEFPEVLDNKGNFVGFDIVIGNPPYIKYQDIKKQNSDVAEHIFNTYKTSTGNFDLYIPFFEKGWEILKPNGVLSFIAPSVWIYTDYGKKMKKIFQNNRYLFKFIDFKSFQVFKDATTYTAVQFLSKKKNDFIFYAEAQNGDVWDIKLNPNDYIELEKNSWRMTSSNDESIQKKVNVRSKPLGSIIDKIVVGIQTSANNIYHLEKVKDNYYFSQASNSVVEIEEQLIRSLISSEEVKRFIQPTTSTFLLFPYQSIGNNYPTLIDRHTMETEYPNAWKYLKDHEAFLRAREDRKMDKEEIWWGYNYPKNLDKQHRPKLCVAQTVRNLKLFLDFQGEYYLDNVRVNGILANDDDVETLWFLLGVLNSTVLNYYFQKTAKPKNNGYYEANKQFIEPLPIPMVNEETKKLIISISKELTQLHTELANVTNRVISRIISHNGNGNLNKLYKWMEMDFDELSKGIEKITKNDLSLSERNNLEVYINEEKQKVNVFRNRIIKLENDLNSLIYSFYNLDEDEIEVIMSSQSKEFI